MQNCLQFAWNVKSCFLEKKKKKNENLKNTSTENYMQGAKH